MKNSERHGDSTDQVLSQLYCSTWVVLIISIVPTILAPRTTRDEVCHLEVRVVISRELIKLRRIAGNAVDGDNPKVYTYQLLVSVYLTQR